ncbi:MAG: protoporphyrinogen oxidase, partial [Gammaproteobacteria bacterium]|nr:protoporphyrinogen oxidase [Gammaproteobacteria bacterium]
DVVVVGGGISGLAIAHSLSRAGLHVELWEGEARVGGKIRTRVKQGYRLESAASMVVNFRSEVDRFLRISGLEHSTCVRSTHATRYLADAERLREVPSGLIEMVRSPLFSRSGKLRLLAEPLVPRGCAPGESVAEFVARRLGKEFLDKAFEPYVAGPLASDIEQAEARAILPKLTALEARYGSVVVGALLGKVLRGGRAMRPKVFSFANGMETLVETLGRAGAFRVRNNLRVSRVQAVRGGWLTSGTSAATPSTVFSRQVVLSTPADVSARLMADVHDELARHLHAIEYASVNVVHTGFRRSDVAHPLRGSGFLVPRGCGYPANGCLWMSQLFPDRAPGDEVLLSSYVGGARNPDAATWSTARTLDAVMGMLRPLLGVRKTPELLHIERHNRALPLYHGAYTQRLAAIDRCLVTLPGLHLEANYKGGVSVRDRILRGEQAAERILKQAEHASRAPSCTPAGMPGIAAAAGMR